jgi:hypothetical protein
MAKFKEFILKEEIGLGDIEVNINKLINSKDFGDQINGAFNSSQWNATNIPTPWKGDDLKDLKNPVDLGFSSVQKTGRIISFLKNKNPIYIRLSDGTECNFTFDELKKIEGIPEIGKTMTVIFQRHPSDITNNFSKITKAIVSD